MELTQLVAPIPVRMVCVATLVEDLRREFETQDQKPQKCLTWSSITFGDKEVHLREICRLGVLWRVLF